MPVMANVLSLHVSAQRRLATRHQCVGRVHVTAQAGRVYQ